MKDIDKIYQGDALSLLEKLKDNSIDCCVTSPPYWGLRDYGNDNQLGLEKTPEEYVSNMVAVFREVKRVLKPQGTFWLNLGDSYSGSGQGAGTKIPTKKQASNKGTNYMTTTEHKSNLLKITGLKPKDLVGIPWMVAFALRADGWYLRSDIIWYKKNPMPESVTDRPTKCHEDIFLLSKSQQYYYDYEAILEPYTEPMNRCGGDNLIAKGESTWDKGVGQETYRNRNMRPNEKGKNKRDVWEVNTKSFSEAHFATFPEKLIVDMIKAGCPEGGLVLDPFMGAGTTGLVAKKLNRHYLGFELNPEYIKIAEKRIFSEIGLFA